MPTKMISKITTKLIVPGASVFVSFRIRLEMYAKSYANHLYQLELVSSFCFAVIVSLQPCPVCLTLVNGSVEA
jgi:hypothetical protein